MQLIYFPTSTKSRLDKKDSSIRILKKSLPSSLHDLNVDQYIFKIHILFSF